MRKSRLLRQRLAHFETLLQSAATPGIRAQILREIKRLRGRLDDKRPRASADHRVAWLHHWGKGAPCNP